MSNLILIEGIPGSGKTTLSQKTFDYLQASGKASVLYQEGDGHPADLAWCACIPEEKFEIVIKQYPQYAEAIRDISYRDEGYEIIPYTKLDIDDKTFYSTMENYEVYDNRCGFEIFTELHKKRWKKFGEEAQLDGKITVFECAYLQNHINELLLFHNMDERDIIDYLLELIQTVKDLNPILIYLEQPKVYETIKRVSDARKNKDGQHVWMERVMNYIADTPYGKRNALSGFDGMVTYFEQRKKIEQKILSQLPIKVFRIENKNYDWHDVWNKIKEIIESQI